MRVKCELKRHICPTTVKLSNYSNDVRLLFPAFWFQSIRRILNAVFSLYRSGYTIKKASLYFTSVFIFQLMSMLCCCPFIRTSKAVPCVRNEHVALLLLLLLSLFNYFGSWMCIVHAAECMMHDACYIERHRAHYKVHTSICNVFGVRSTWIWDRGARYNMCTRAYVHPAVQHIMYNNTVWCRLVYSDQKICVYELLARDDVFSRYSTHRVVNVIASFCVMAGLSAVHKWTSF